MLHEAQPIDLVNAMMNFNYERNSISNKNETGKINYISEHKGNVDFLPFL